MFKCKKTLGIRAIWPERVSVAAIGIAACLAAGCGSDNNTEVAPGSGTVSGSAGNGSAIAAATGGTQAVGAAGLATTGKGVPVAGKSSNTGKGAGGKAGKAGKTGAAAGKSIGGTAGKGGEAAPEKCNKIPPSSKDCTAPLAPGDDRWCTILNNRGYFMYAPPTYNPCVPTALVVDCHGAIETAEEAAGLDDTFAANGMEWPGEGSGWRLEANTKGGGFIVATPQGINNAWSTANNDPAFFLAMIEEIKKVANIDPKKVYMTGISNGSMITYQTVCPNTNVFAAIAPHAAGVACDSIQKPISVISFDAEPDFAYAQTVAGHDRMIELNGCTGTENPNWLVIDSKTTDTVCRNDPYDTNPKLVPCNTIKSTSITPNGIEPTVCRRTDGCKDGVAVVFCEVAPSTLHGAVNASSDAHIIYGNATSLNTPSVAWRFFKSFW